MNTGSPPDSSSGGTEPLYERLKLVIRERIEKGEYKAGSVIPSTADLAGEFSVSAITVRRAVNDLITEGRLRGRPGLGVFVNAASRVTRSLGNDFVTSLGERMLLQGITPGLRQLSLELVVPDEEIRTTLKLSGRTLVYRHEKLILADGHPVCVDTSHIPRDVGLRLLDNLADEFLLQLLHKAKISIGSIDYRVEARGALEQEAAHLGASIGSPLLKVRYVPRDATGRALFVGETRSRPEWFSYEFHVPAPTALGLP